MKKILLALILFFSLTINCYAENYCNKDAISQMSKIIYHECGNDSATDSKLNFFMRLTTGGVVLNNASYKSGNTIYEKMLKFTDTNYSSYSKYKNKTLEASIPNSTKRSEIIYTSALVLSGKYTLPKNMIFQAADYIVKKRTVWTYVPTSGLDVYFGYSGTLETVDVFGAPRTSDVDYYKKLAESLKLSDYSVITLDNVCSYIASMDKNFTVNNNYIVEGINGGNVYKNKTVSFSVDTTNSIIKIEYKYDDSNYKETSLRKTINIDLDNTYGFDRTLILKFRVTYTDSTTKEFTYSLKYNIDSSKYVVNYYIDDNIYESESYTKSSLVSLIIPSNKAGYSFSGWYDSNNIKVDKDFIITSNVKLYGRYESRKSNVKFIIDNEVVNTYDIDTGSRIELPNTKDKLLYKFSGWYINNNLIDSNYIVYNDITLIGTYEFNYVNLLIVISIIIIIILLAIIGYKIYRRKNDGYNEY